MLFLLLVKILLSVVVSLFLLGSLLFLLPKRQHKIGEIIRDLKNLSDKTTGAEKYAIAENIRFFEAQRTLHGYLWWGMFHRPKIIPGRLLEIADLPLPKWEKELYDDLTTIERRAFPGLSVPLRKLLLNEILKGNKKTLIELGCGSMEVERQVLIDLEKGAYNVVPVFIGVDQAPQAWDSIREVFSEFGDRVTVKKLKSPAEIKGSHSKPTVYFYCDDALNAAKKFKGKYDLIFSSRFRHHLNDREKQQLEKIHKSTPHAVEYDDYGSALSWVPPLITAWNRPVLLNGAVFSHIRQLTKKEVLNTRKNDKRIKTLIFNPPGSYAKVYINKNGWWDKDD